MNKYEKELLAAGFKTEKEVIKKLEEQLNQALDNVNAKIIELMGREDIENKQSIIYQLKYQNAIKGQIEGIMTTLQANQFTTIQDYLQQCYEDGYIGVMYDLQHQGIPLTIPIDQEQMVQAIVTDSKLSEPLYEHLGMNIKQLKKEIRQELTRGIAANASRGEIARQIKIRGDVYNSKAYRIARTEGHRIQEKAKIDAQHKAKNAGANIVKQWDAALDRRTRSSHAALDGQIREIDEPFEYGGHKAMSPGDFGVTALDINCRCTVIQRAKWALDEEELKTLEERAKTFGLDKTKDFEEYKKKYSNFK